MKKLICLLLISLFAGAGQSQSINKDSLLNELKTAKEDTTKVILCRILAGTLRLSKPAEAIRYGKEGISLGKKLDFHKGTAGCYLNVSASYSTMGQLDSAILYIDTAIYYSHKAGDPNRLALVYLNRADCYMQLQNFEQSLKDCHTSLRYAEQVNSDDRRARVLQTFGSIYFFQKLYDQSADYYNRALGLYKKINNLQMSAIVLNNLALVHKNSDQYKEAADNMLQAIGIADSLHDVGNLSLYYGTLSDVYFNTGDYEAAEKYADSAMHYARQIGNEMSVADAWGYLGQVYLKKGKTSEGTAALASGYAIFKKLENFDKVNLTAGMLAEAYASSGDFEKAYQLLIVSRDANDTLARRRFADDITAMQTRFKVDEKDKEIQLLDKNRQLQSQKINQQRILLTASVIIILIILAGIWLLISRYRLRQRMKELQLRNEIAADLHDEVGSSLSSIHMLSEMACAPETSVDSKKEMLHKVTSYSKETMDKMGDIVWMIKQDGEDGKDLQERMQRLLYEMCSSKNISHQFDGELLQTLKLNTEQKKAIYLIFKEAVNNALKYASPEHIHVSISKQQNMVRLKIADNGKGFDRESVQKGNGLINMQNRAKELGGKTEIVSSGKGTIVVCTFPV
ncbi:MAG: sensor histidine kinase [Chitinophagaceae bacterium]